MCPRRVMMTGLTRYKYWLTIHSFLKSGVNLKKICYSANLVTKSLWWQQDAGLSNLEYVNRNPQKDVYLPKFLQFIFKCRKDFEGGQKKLGISSLLYMELVKEIYCKPLHWLVALPVKWLYYLQAQFLLWKGYQLHFLPSSLHDLFIN